MREIKFRAWDKYLKEMITKFSLCEATCLNDDGDLIAGKYDTSEDYYELELMQYTGLKDKNNKEIYEGDIIREINTPNNLENPEYIYYHIKFEEGSFILCNDKYLIDHYKTFIDFDIGENEIEVIGNIYENPELLENGE